MIIDFWSGLALVLLGVFLVAAFAVWFADNRSRRP